MQKPEWLKIRPPTKLFSSTKQTVQKYGLTTICVEGHCPNLSECWDTGTATFMILGDTCTRACRFCNVKTNIKGQHVDPLEPQKLVAAIKELKIFNYIVLTSVDRDDLPDEGSTHFANCIKAIKEHNPAMIIEVLIPDFKGNKEFLKTIIDAKPDVVAHNVETTKSLQRKVRDRRANYEQSLLVLKQAKELGAPYTKSALMVGLGESIEEVNQTMQDLKDANVDMLTIGQYLQPTKRHLNIEEYVPPEVFTEYKEAGEKLGLHITAGPFVRSSYRAGEVYREMQNA